MSALLDLVRARRAELQKARRRAKHHHIGPIDVGPLDETLRRLGFVKGPDACYTPQQQALIDSVVEKELARLRAAGEWMDGDKIWVRVIVGPSLEQQDRSREASPDPGADYDHSGSHRVMIDRDPPCRPPRHKFQDHPLIIEGQYRCPP
jgi:hypothetical protein